jgi:amino acid transporter
LLLTSVTAAALSFHNTTARYAFSLGRERVAPAWMGRTAPRSCAPAAASMTQTVIGAVVILTWAALGLDPLVHLFFYMGTAGGLGLLVLLTACSIAVAVFFLRDRRGEHTFTAYIAPAVACLAMGAILWLSVLHFHTLLGVDPGHPLPRIVPIVIAALAVTGTCWGLVLRWRRPQVYAGIGRGARADLARTAAAQAVEGDR